MVSSFLGACRRWCSLQGFVHRVATAPQGLGYLADGHAALVERLGLALLLLG
jgi:hypothetical protein